MATPPSGTAGAPVAWLLAAGLTLVSIACVTPSPRRAVTELESPASPGSAEPNLARGADGRLYLSWIEEQQGGGHALRFAVREVDAWSAARTIATGEDWFVNWADFPSLAALADGTLAAHRLVRSAPATYAYDVVLSVSQDGGDTWSDPVRPHADGTETEHGFVSLVPLAESFGVFWLDGRETAAEPPGPMTLRHALLDRQGRVFGEMLVDDSVCDCCQTDAVALANGELLVAYRDRTAGETRDVRVARVAEGRVASTTPVHDDGWQTAACPVNGPALAAAGDRVACAWFTLAGGERGRVRLALSQDGGRTFGPPIEVDAGNPAGRVDLSLLGDGSALVAWLERGEPAAILVRRVAPDGRLGEAVTATATSGARSSGFPRLARRDGDLLLAWTAPETPPRVRTAEIRGFASR